MRVETSDVRLAYSYAWWLTGDDDRAAHAVLAALERPDVTGAGPDLRLEIFLRRVRAAAVTTPTMCPASELAILHDGIGMPLDTAAGLVAVDVRDARSELAHGRLEALPDLKGLEIPEPERLGGLAVGNPADIAAARQLPELAEVRRQLLAGRDELASLTPKDPPASLLRAAASQQARPTAPPVDEVEVDLSAELAAGPHAPARRRGRRGRWLWGLVAVGVIGGALTLLLTRSDEVLPGATPEVTSPAEDDPVLAVTPTASPTTAGTPTLDATPTATPTAELGFVVEDLSVLVGAEDLDLGANPVVGPFDLVKFEVAYRNAVEGTTLISDWRVDGVPYTEVEVTLSARRENQRWAEPIPSEGWPLGQHTITVHHEGEELGQLQFVVRGEDQA